MIYHQKEIEVFRSLFRCRTDVYARRWEKDGRSGYSPAYEFNWDEFMAHRRRGGSLKDFPNKRLLPLTDIAIKKHLIGQEIIGVYPILPDNTSYFLTADFDGEHWKSEAQSFIDLCAQNGLNTYLERSRSGNGGHVWLFFAVAYPCYRSRQIGLEFIRQVYKISEFVKEISFDRLFPNQDSVSQNGFGNLIALPFQGKAVAEGNTLFLESQTGSPFLDQWGMLSEITHHTLQEMEDVYQRVVGRDATWRQSPEIIQESISLHVGARITLHRSQIGSTLMAFLKDELNFINNEYLTKRRLGKSIYDVEKYFKLIDEEGDEVSIPKGFLLPLTDFMNKEGTKHSVYRGHPVLGELPFVNSIKLTPNQASAVAAAMEHEQGVIVAPPGSGKTIIGLEIIARKKLPALILVHRKQILDQWVDRIQSFLEIPKTHIGQFSGVKKKCGDQITVGLLQSLARMKDLSELANQFGTIIVDECHHIPASTFREVVKQLNSQYIYGLTATPKRKHNDEKLIYAYIGNIIARLETSDVTSASTIEHPLEVVIRSTNISIPFKYTTDLFQLLSRVICFDTARNQLIVDDILAQSTNGRKILVLSERKEHLDILHLYLKGKCETIVITGDDSARARKSKIGQIQGGNYQVILSTGQFFGEGIDVQGITCLILAFPFSFEGKLIQHLGRLRGSGDQKTIIDYRDKNIPFLDRQFKQRERYYRKFLKTNMERQDRMKKTNL